MKKLAAVLLVLVMAVGVVGCVEDGVPQSEYDKVVSERDALKAELDELKSPKPEPTPEHVFKDLLTSVVISTSKPNSAGGVDVSIKFINRGSQIKYITFTAVPYNAVNDTVKSEVGNKSSTRLKLTGPVKAATEGGGLWENVWYNSTIKRAEVTEVEIEYMDGSVISFEGNDIICLSMLNG